MARALHYKSTETWIKVENWQLALTLLVAVLVGASLPVIVELWSTLRGLKRLVKHTDELVIASGPGLERTITEIGTAAAHLNRVGSALEQGDTKVRELMGTLDGLKDWLTKIKRGATIVTVLGATVVPLVVEALRRAKEHSEQKAAAEPPGNDVSKNNHVEKEMES